MAKTYASSVEVYGEIGFIYRESRPGFAQRMVQDGKAERICKGKVVRALRLISPLNPEQGHERVSSLKRYSSLGQAHDTGMSYIMREYSSHEFAPQKAQRLFLNVLASAGAEIKRCG